MASIDLDYTLDFALNLTPNPTANHTLNIHKPNIESMARRWPRRSVNTPNQEVLSVD
jgi:hypothetical protein